MRALIELNPETNEPLCDTPVSWFLLIQKGQILDCTDSPVTLAYARANKQADIYVAVGVVNEFGDREIAGVCGHYSYTPFVRCWHVSVDGLPSYEAEVMGQPGELLRGCLYTLKRKGRLSDPCNLGKVTIMGGR